MKIKIWFKMLAIASVSASWLCFFHAMLVAWRFGNWKIQLDFNSVGEGYLELIIMILSVPLILWYFYEDIKEWKK